VKFKHKKFYENEKANRDESSCTNTHCARVMFLKEMKLRPMILKSLDGRIADLISTAKPGSHGTNHTSNTTVRT
jgi:hypothetical protein